MLRNLPYKKRERGEIYNINKRVSDVGLSFVSITKYKPFADTSTFFRGSLSSDFYQTPPLQGLKTLGLTEIDYAAQPLRM